MTFENVTFNLEFWKGKSEAEFLKHESHHGLSKEQLIEAFKIINPLKIKSGGTKKPPLT